ncbi:MAG: hypothetical protein AAGE52_15195 [Myxococcota bacterium]
MRQWVALVFLCAACGDDATTDPLDAGADAAIDTGSGPVAHWIRGDVEVSLVEVYAAAMHTEGPVTREWLPKDLGAHPDGELWVVQQMERDPSYDDETECTAAATAGGAPNDCVSLQGSTVAIRDPSSDVPATADNGRANLVVDFNAWHFMRRPSGIAFGARELVLDHTHPGAEDTGLTEPVVFTNTFATCHEHWTANATDMPPFIGPTLWTADSAIYNGDNGDFDWSNGSHLDMVHATRYCMGIAYESGNTYWAFDGNGGFLDRYDFGSPHHPGHHNHDDADIERYFLPLGDRLLRVPNVPSNMLIHGDELWVADTGNGRVLRFDLSGGATIAGSTRSFEGYEIEVFDGMTFAEVLTTEEPSGLTRLADGTMLVADHTSGELIVFERDGTEIRRIQVGGGLGGLTNIGDAIYVVQMDERRVVRLDPVE